MYFYNRNYSGWLDDGFGEGIILGRDGPHEILAQPLVHVGHRDLEVSVDPERLDVVRRWLRAEIHQGRDVDEFKVWCFVHKMNFRLHGCFLKSVGRRDWHARAVLLPIKYP